MKSIISQLPNRSNFRRGRYTIEVGYPWVAYGAIIVMERYLNADHNVLELGAGGSTIFFSKRCKSVKSYEGNPEWANKVRVALPESSNVSIVVGKEDELIESIRNEPDAYYDWLLADIGKTYEFRLRIMKEGIPKLKKGGLMVVDNYEEKNMATFDYTGWDVYRFDDFKYRFNGTIVAVKL